MKIDIRDYTSPNDFHKSENDIAKELLELRYIDKDFFLLNHLFNKTLGKQNYTQEQMECKYCHGEADLNDTDNSNFQLNLDMEDECDPRLAVSYEDEFCDYDSVSISYCPRCGRKLSDQGNGN